jgi:hypothetical protein
MITLPAIYPVVRKSHPHFKAFCLSLGLVGFSLISILWAFLQQPVLTIGLLAVVPLTSAGLFWPRVIMLAYRIWNRLARQFGEFASELILRICFFVILSGTGLAGSAIRLNPPGSKESFWKPRGTVLPEVYHHRFSDALKRQTGEQGWISSLLSWAHHSGNIWVFGLVPFILLLSMLDSHDRDSKVSDNIYTLY